MQPLDSLLAFELPRVHRWQLRLFAGYTAFYLRRHFHALHLLPVSDLHRLQEMPVMVCLNHPSWWDPLIGIYLSQRFFAARNQYVPIAAKGLEKYKLFERFGFFGIDPETRRGAQRFLELGQAVLGRSDGVFWVTAQGRFTDVRTRPVKLQNGVGHLTRRANGPFAMLPVALEYAFWEERTPEAFVCCGEPVYVTDGRSKTAHEWTQLFSNELERTQDTLSAKVLTRQASAFEPLLQGHAGVGGLYDLWRGVKALARGKPFRPEHGTSVR